MIRAKRQAGCEIIAPLKQRIQRVMQQRQLTRDQAEKHVKEADEGRRDFVRRYFNHDVSDPRLYDLIINLEQLDIDDAVALIVHQCRRRA